MQAVQLDRYRSVLFSIVEIPEDLRPEIVDGLGGEILDGVTLVIPPEVLTNGRPHGALLARSRSDPSYFELVKDRDEANLRGLDLVGKRHHVIRSEANWRRYLEMLNILQGIAANATGVEAPDSPEDPD